MSVYRFPAQEDRPPPVPNFQSPTANPGHEEWTIEDTPRTPSEDPAMTDSPSTPDPDDDGLDVPTSPLRLFGEPMAESLYADIDEAWAKVSGDVLEEYTVRPTSSHLPPVDDVLQWICEWSAESGELDEYGYDAIDNAVNHADVEAAVAALYDTIGTHVTYRMADELVATHHRPAPGGSE